MQKIILDTNVLVSALIQKSYPYLIVFDCVVCGTVSLCLSNELAEEYIEVLNRPKFSKYIEFAAQSDYLLAYLLKNSEIYKPKTKVDILSDPDDNKLLELAEASNADYLLTGNTNDFIIENYKNTKIVTPKEYWEEFRP